MEAVSAWNDLEVGMTVSFVKEGVYPAVQGSNWREVKAGEEFVISRKIEGGILWLRNIRGSSYGPSLRANFREVRIQSRPIGQAPEGAVDAFDPRVAWIFEDAARMATRLGMCSDFDRLLDALGWPGRERDISLTYSDPEAGIRLTAVVRARSRREAQARLRTGQSNLRVTDMRELTL